MLSASGEKAIALDVDDCLSDTCIWFAEKLHEKFGNTEGLTPIETIKKYRYSYRVPEWQSEEALEYALNANEEPETFEGLLPIPGAIQAANTISKIIPIFYLTGRVETVKHVTESWLEKNDFPKAPTIHRPKSIGFKSFNNWKAKMLERLYPEVVGIIDDHDSLASSISPEYNGKIFLYNHPNAKIKENVIPCTDWKDVVEKVQIFKKTV